MFFYTCITYIGLFTQHNFSPTRSVMSHFHSIVLRLILLFMKNGRMTVLKNTTTTTTTTTRSSQPGHCRRGRSESQCHRHSLCFAAVSRQQLVQCSQSPTIPAMGPQPGQFLCDKKWYTDTTRHHCDVTSLYI